jgi:hypothetical protein
MAAVCAIAILLAGGIWLRRKGDRPIPAPAAAAPPALEYSIEAQKMGDGRPLGEPYAASAADTFEAGWRFRIGARPYV